MHLEDYLPTLSQGTIPPAGFISDKGPGLRRDTFGRVLRITGLNDWSPMRIEDIVDRATMEGELPTHDILCCAESIDMMEVVQGFLDRLGDEGSSGSKTFFAFVTSLGIMTLRIQKRIGTSKGLGLMFRHVPTIDS